PEDDSAGTSASSERAVSDASARTWRASTGQAEAKLDELAMDPGSTPGGIRTMHLDDEISNLWLVQGTAIGCSSASTGGSLVGASGPRSPGGRGGVLDAIPAKVAKARTRAPGRRSESGPAFRRTGT